MTWLESIVKLLRLYQAQWLEILVLELLALCLMPYAATRQLRKMAMLMKSLLH